MIRYSPAAIAFVLGSVALAASAALACSNRDDGFAGNHQDGFARDASSDEVCPFQCSLDGRSVIQSCTGTVVETCRPELACGAGACQEPCAAAAADQSSNGCEFFLQPARFTKEYGQGCYAAYLVNTAVAPIDVSLELKGEKLDISKALFRLNSGPDSTWTPLAGRIEPGESAVLFVSGPTAETLEGEGATSCPAAVTPATTADPLPEGTGFGSSFRISTSAPVSAAAIYPYSGSDSHVASATLLLPVASWGTEHVLMNAWEQMSTAIYVHNGGPAAQIVAAEDGTEVTILPKRAIQDGEGFVGGAANVPVTAQLNRGQLLQINQADELSGSIVTSNKPTSIFGGHECMNVPSSRVACDFALQQLPPFAQWGSEYVGIGYRPRLGDEHEPMPYRIVAARDGTRLDYDPVVPPGAPLELSAGEVITFWSGTGEAFVVRSQDAEHPFYLAALMAGGGPVVTGSDFLGTKEMGGRGDPEFVNVVPAKQYLNTYSFFADPSYQETALTIVRAKDPRGAFKDVWLECAGVLPDFKPIGTRGDYEYTRVDLSRDYGPGQTFGDSVCTKGLQRMKSEGPFSATLWGWSQYTSYAYPSGQAQRKLVTTPLVPVK